MLLNDSVLISKLLDEEEPLPLLLIHENGFFKEDKNML